MATAVAPGSRRRSSCVQTILGARGPWPHQARDLDEHLGSGGSGTRDQGINAGDQRRGSTQFQATLGPQDPDPTGLSAWLPGVYQLIFRHQSTAALPSEEGLVIRVSHLRFP